ncbi:peptidoglycan-binding protein [Variovorax sp. J22R24]|uniref:peptidoglycan-binding protein n=1 Tax=Variovorax gracilis TaxID=3053502 RepID=UPI002578C055|nr:peptidoglycan-binding protein [Variovorax sp. J22R24]MDM0107956.1 peptidoglycan-binding protein [Variovorax sp. J22R24]
MTTGATGLAQDGELEEGEELQEGEELGAQTKPGALASRESTAFGPVEAVAFPGQIVKVGSPDAEVVRHIQRRLNALGCGPIPEDGVFDKQMQSAVKLFQARFPDVTGAPLEADGRVGSLTWGALFGAATVPSQATAPSPLAEAAIAFALTQVGVMEDPLGSNRGPEVDRYLKAVGLNPAAGSFAWCVAFTHFCYQAAAEQLGRANPHIRTAGVLDHWNKAGSSANAVRVTKAKAIADPGLVQPGSLFIIDLGQGLGHSGMVIEVADGRLVTVEGNTNDNGSRNGIGVFKRNARKIAQINKGFIDYSRA